MTYSDRFVMCILVDGKPLRELANGVVPIKFGTQYSIRLRNKNNRRAVAKITVDGETVSGGGIIVPAYDYVDIHRRTDKDVAFKFVELDSPEAVDAGKNGPNPDKVKGTIQVSFFLERKPEPKVNEIHHWYPIYPKYNSWPTWGTPFLGSSGLSTGSIGSSLGSNSLRGMTNDTNSNSINVSCSAKLYSSDIGHALTASNLNDGCTVDGGSTGQQFYTSYIDTEYQSVTLTLFLQGYTVAAPRKIKKAVVVDKQLEELERENAELRKQLALIENEKLKKAIKQKSKKRTISE